MSKKHVRRVTRYSLTIAFEEIYTKDSGQLEASANVIGEVIAAIQQVLTADATIQAKLTQQNLKLHMMAPERVSTWKSLPRVASIDPPVNTWE